MYEQFERTEALIEKTNFAKLCKAKILVFGVGGVGGYVVEGLARSGIGQIDLVDNDVISISNLNRQIIATFDSIGQPKVEVMKKRILSIHPNCVVNTFQKFILPEDMDSLQLDAYDYVVDAIDTVSTKLSIVELCLKKHIPVISSMGTGNKLDPKRLEITDISKTSVCPLARVMRYELRKRGIHHLKVCYSKEEPVQKMIESEKPGKHSPASIFFVPSSAGILIASEVVKDIIRK